MNRTIKKKVYGVLAFLAGIVFLWFVWYSMQLYKEKMAARERLNQTVSYETSVMQKEEITYQGKVYERNPSIKAILFLGVDSSGDMEVKVSGSGGQADTIFLIAYNAARETAKLLMIPRDTMTPITLTDLSGNVLGKDRQHLTLAYAYGDGRELSCERTSEAVSELLHGLRIDGYMAMNTTLIREFNDLAGGVTVTIETDGMEKRDPALKKGETVTLQGKQAEIFIRYRDISIDNSAIERMSQQTQYLEAYMKAVKEQAAKDDQTIVRIMDTVEKKMITNLSKPQYMEMGKAILNSKNTLTREEIRIIPGETVVTNLYDEFHHDPEGTLQIVLELFYREK